MVTELLHNSRAERIRRVTALSTRAGRRRQGEFLAEGPQCVRESILAWMRRLHSAHETAASGAQTLPLVDVAASAHLDAETASALPMLRRIFFEPEALDHHSDIAALFTQIDAAASNLPLGQSPVGLYPVSHEVMKAISDAETPQGMVAVCTIPETAARWRHTRLGLGLCRVQDPGNMGTMIRTADAAGADAVFLSSGSVDPWNPKVVRSSAGSCFHMPIYTSVETAALADWFRAQTLDEPGDSAAPRVLATAAHDARPLPDVETPEAPTLWLIGNEAQGLSEAEIAAADAAVSIPMYGHAESLNAATAATICLYHSAMAQNSQAAQDRYPTPPAHVDPQPSSTAEAG